LYNTLEADSNHTPIEKSLPNKPSYHTFFVTLEPLQLLARSTDLVYPHFRQGSSAPGHRHYFPLSEVGVKFHISPL
jgi:hypothetical protein